MLYKLYLEGVDGYVKYIEANHMKGTLNELWPSITDEDYGRLVSDAEALKKSIRYALEYSEQIAQSSYYDVLSEIDQKAVTDSGMEPVIPLITEEQNAAYLQQVESGSQLYADFVVTKDTTLAGDVETFGDVIFKSGTLDLNGHVLLTHGSMTMSGGTANLNAGTLTVKGDLLQSGGTMYCNKGTLNVGGDYRIQSATTNDDGEVIYNLSYGVLKMSKEPDRINVGGSFVTQGNGNSSSILTAGVMTVKGDFTQLNHNGWGDNFAASGTHKVVLDGQGVQTVSFQNSSSFFNELEITKPLETGYVFSRMPCWKTLTYVSREPNINVIGGENAPACQVDGQTLTVTCDRACVAAYKDADENYVRLIPTANADGSYSYTLPEGVSEVTVAVRGDLDGDGKLTAKEARRVMTAVTRADSLNTLQMLCADLNGDGKISAMEARQILSAVTNSAAVKW